MITEQRIAIWLAVLLVLATCLYPPWMEPRYTFDKEQENEIQNTALKMQQGGESTEAIRKFAIDYQHRYGHPHVYHWLFDTSANSRGQVAHVDLSRLVVEWVICLVLSAGLYLAGPRITVTKDQLLKTSWKIGEWLIVVAIGIVFIAGLLAYIQEKLKEPNGWIFVGLLCIYGFVAAWRLIKRRA